MAAEIDFNYWSVWGGLNSEDPDAYGDPNDPTDRRPGGGGYGDTPAGNPFGKGGTRLPALPPGSPPPPPPPPPPGGGGTGYGDFPGLGGKSGLTGFFGGGSYSPILTGYGVLQPGPFNTYKGGWINTGNPLDGGGIPPSPIGTGIHTPVTTRVVRQTLLQKQELNATNASNILNQILNWLGGLLKKGQISEQYTDNTNRLTAALNLLLASQGIELLDFDDTATGDLNNDAAMLKNDIDWINIFIMELGDGTLVFPGLSTFDATIMLNEILQQLQQAQGWVGDELKKRGG